MNSSSFIIGRLLSPVEPGNGCSTAIQIVAGRGRSIFSCRKPLLDQLHRRLEVIVIEAQAGVFVSFHVRQRVGFHGKLRQHSKTLNSTKSGCKNCTAVLERNEANDDKLSAYLAEYDSRPISYACSTLTGKTT